MTSVATFPSGNHDHRRRVTAILADAEHLCQSRNVRLTAQRRSVLAIVADSHGAIGAYDILARLAKEGRRLAPISIYRALDFLIEQGLVHRIASLNAYVACAYAAKAHGAQFLICNHCGTIGEVTSPAVDQAICGAASDLGFAVATPVVEVAGICRHCRPEKPDVPQS